MKCHQHNSSEAIGVCVSCGRALCQECAPTSPAAPLACSSVCAQNAAQLKTTIQLLLERGEQNARASAVYYYLSALLSGGAAIAAWFWLPSPFLMFFAGGGALVLLAAGFWHGRLSSKKVPHQKANDRFAD